MGWPEFIGRRELILSAGAMVEAKRAGDVVGARQAQSEAQLAKAKARRCAR